MYMVNDWLRRTIGIYIYIYTHINNNDNNKLYFVSACISKQLIV